MLDHLYGKPSTTWKRIEAILVTLASIKVLKAYHGNKRPPAGKCVGAVDRRLRAFAPWQIVLGTFTSGYLLSKFSLFTFMNSPEPFARYYSKNFYRATWILVALDAGFWTAMYMKPKFLRDVCSILFTLFYLVFANRAEQKVRRLRSTPTLNMMRVSWEKQKHPLFLRLTRLLLPRVTWRGRRIAIPRSSHSFGYNPADPRTTELSVYLYYNGHPDKFELVNQVILHVPGGGFVCMDPVCHEDYLTTWAAQSPLSVVVALDYGKAPEYPYPFALEECFELYRLIRESNGACLGLQGWYFDVTVTTGGSDGKYTTKTERKRKTPIRITLSGDSAGGNLATGVCIRAIESGVMVPTALILIYPFLNIDFTCWLSPNHTQLLRSESTKNMNLVMDIKDQKSKSSANLLSSTQGPKTDASSSLLGAAPHQARQSAMAQDEAGQLERKRSFFEIASSKLSALRTQKPQTVFDDYGGSLEHTQDAAQHAGGQVPTSLSNSNLALLPGPAPWTPGYGSGSHTPTNTDPGKFSRAYDTVANQLAMTSHMCHFNDRVLTPETMRALALLYLGPSTVRVDVANDYHLSPIQTPENILAQFPKTYFLCGEKDPLVDDTIIFAGRIRSAKQRAWRAESGLHRPRDEDIAYVRIFEGASHAILQMMAFLPEAKLAASLILDWCRETFAEDECHLERPGEREGGSPRSSHRAKDGVPVRFTIGDTDGATTPQRGTPSTSPARAAGRRVRQQSAPGGSAENALTDEEIVFDPKSEERRLLELRDNAHVSEDMLLARRTMHVSHGLFGDQETSKKSHEVFRQKNLQTPRKGSRDRKVNKS